jgi:osmotically-inducible protein OsmY
MTRNQKLTTAVGLSVAAVAIAAAISTMALRHAQQTLPQQQMLQAEVITKTPQFSEAAITEALRQQSITIDKLSVRSFNGIVILRGNADPETAGRAINALQSMGVDRIANLITPAAPSRDEEIRREAERELASAGSLDGTRLQVSCQDGILRLSGTVANEYQRDAAHALLRSIRGTKGVQVDLAVASASL